MFAAGSLPPHGRKATQHGGRGLIGRGFDARPSPGECHQWLGRFL